MIERELESVLLTKMKSGKAIILLGAHQTGKTTLLKTLFQESKEALWLNGDELDVQSLLENISVTRLKAILAGKTVLIIDEAQRIKDVGLRLNLITNQIPEVRLIVTGSSAFCIQYTIIELNPLLYTGFHFFFATTK